MKMIRDGNIMRMVLIFVTILTVSTFYENEENRLEMVHRSRNCPLSSSFNAKSNRSNTNRPLLNEKLYYLNTSISNTRHSSAKDRVSRKSSKVLRHNEGTSFGVFKWPAMTFRQ